MRSSLSGSSLSGLGAPIASGLKKLRGSFIRRSSCGSPRRRQARLCKRRAKIADAAIELASLQRDVRAFDHLAPELGLLRKKLCRLRTTLAGGFHLNAARLLRHLGPSENLHDIAID